MAVTVIYSLSMYSRTFYFKHFRSNIFDIVTNNYLFFVAVFGKWKVMAAGT